MSWEEKFDEKFRFWIDREQVKDFIHQVRQDAKAEMAREALRISRAAFSRMQLVAEELANRQGDDQARKLIYDIKEKYEELLDQLTDEQSSLSDKEKE